MSPARRRPTAVRRLGVLAAAVALGGSAAPAAAQTFTNTLAGAPTFNRPIEGFGGLSGVGTNVRYRTLLFTVSTPGSYSFLMSSGVGGFDTFLLLYQNAFDPAAPLANGIASSDDLGGSLTQSGFALTLATGTQYTLVQTAFNNSDTGAFTTTISGPASVVTGTAVIPEPSTWALLGTGLAGVGVVARRRRAATA